MKIILFILLFCLQAPLLQAEPLSIKHIVLCWLTNPGDAALKETVIQTSRELRNIPQVEAISVGTSLPSDRKIVDDSFDVGMVMSFRDEKNLNEYLEHPYHLERVKNILAPSCEKILVYDIAY